MKQLRCEMCGSSDLIKQDGVFVCQSCGCKYSVEEARKMMVEGVVEVTGTVKVDSSDRIDNMLINAKRAFSDRKFAEAEKLFGLVLNEDPENATAILYQGLSLGWQGNTVRYYMDKTGAATERAIDIAHAQMKDGPEFAAFVDDALVQTRTIGEAIVNLCVKNIGEIADRANRSISRMKSSTSIYSDTSYLMQRTTDIQSNMASESEKLYKIIDNTFLIVVSTYNKALENLSNVEEYPEVLYKKMKSYLTQAVNLGSHLKSHMYVSKANALVRVIDEYLKRKADLALLAKKKKVDEYWTKHPDRKSSLDREKAELTDEKDELTKKRNEFEKQLTDLKRTNYEDVPTRAEIKEIESKVAQLYIDKAKLGWFKGKEKKAIDDQITALEQKKRELEPIAQQQEAEKKATYEHELAVINSALSPISNRINEITTRCNIINNELENPVIE